MTVKPNFVLSCTQPTPGTESQRHQADVTLGFNRRDVAQMKQFTAIYVPVLINFTDRKLEAGVKVDSADQLRLVWGEMKVRKEKEYVILDLAKSSTSNRQEVFTSYPSFSLFAQRKGSEKKGQPEAFKNLTQILRSCLMKRG